MAKTLLEEALEDAKLLRQTAMENAKNVLVEAMTEKVQQYMETQGTLGEMDMPMDEMGNPLGNPMFGQNMHANQLPMQMPLGQEAAMYEKQDPEEDAESDLMLMKQLGVQDGEDDHDVEADFMSADEENEEEAPKPKAKDKGGDKKAKSNKKEKEDDMDEVAEPTLEDVQLEAKCDDEEEKEDKVDEVVEITNEDLKAALSEVLGSLRLKEASVSKGFADVTTPDEGGLLDKKAGEHQWKDEEAPAAQDMTVKEAKKLLSAYKNKVASLQKENAEYLQVCKTLKKSLQEVTLFNSKLLYTQKVLNSTELNNKQRIGIIEAFDHAESMREVELVYKSLSESFKIAGVLGESKKVPGSSKVAKASRFSTPSSTVLKEAISREGQESDAEVTRLQRLAGLID